MKVIDMEDISLFEDIYKRVLSDEQTRTFFHKLTVFSNNISLLDKTLEEKELKDIKPDLSNISKKINQLIESGVDIDDKNWWLSEELYSSNSSFGDFYFDTSFLSLFLNVNLNGFKLEIHDFNYLGSRINVPENRKDGLLRFAFPAPIKLVEDYSIWSKNNKNLAKDIEKAEKKYSTTSNESKKSVLKSQISFMKKNLERGNQMKQRIEFFESLTNEQITLIHEIFNEVKSAKIKYDENKELIDQITEKYKRLESTTYERAFIKLIEQGTTQSEISTIITKIFKTIFVGKFMGQDITVPETIPKKHLFLIDLGTIVWFVKFKEEEFIKLYNEIFDNFDLFYESFEEKVLNKKS